MANEPNSENQHLTGDAAVEKVRALLKHFRSTMMVTTVNGVPHSRPMGIQGDAKSFNGELWFFTEKECEKVEEIQAEPQVALLFQSDSNSAYMHLSGTAAVVHDLAKMKELYTPMIKTWFPEGLADPRLTMIRFNAERGNFWDSPGGALQVFAAFTKAIVTGKRGQAGEAGEVRL